MQVSFSWIIFFFNIIVIALVGNKGDLFEKEQVNENEAKQYAKEIGASFNITSAFTGIGVDALFHNIGCKILNPDYKDINKEDNDNEKQLPQIDTIKLNLNQTKEEKNKKCCNYF